MFGLRGEIEHSVAEQHFETHVELLAQCYVSKNSLKKIHEERDLARQGQRDHDRAFHQFKLK